MYAAGLPSETLAALPPQPRARGVGRINVCEDGGATRLVDLYQQGSSKILVPRGEAPGLNAVLLNTAGGITGGDRFAWSAAAGEGARLTLSTQAAERAYRAQPGETGEIKTTLSIGDGARVDWLPQETILYDGAALSRRLTVEMAPDAALLAVEPVIFGREAMGEEVTRASLTDQWRIYRDGRLVHAEALRLAGPVRDILAGPGTLCGGRAMATVIYIAPDAEDRLGPVRAIVGDGAAASAWEGKLAVRIAAPDGAALRKALIPVLMDLRGGVLPRVWTM